MSVFLRVAINVLIVAGGFFALAGTLGVIRMPDTYCRMQSSTCIATLGILGVILGALLCAIFVEKNASMAVKIIVVGLFVFLTNPVANHALAKGAYKRGIRPPQKMVIDDFEEDAPHE